MKRLLFLGLIAFVAPSRIMAPSRESAADSLLATNATEAKLAPASPFGVTLLLGSPSSWSGDPAIASTTMARPPRVVRAGPWYHKRCGLKLKALGELAGGVSVSGAIRPLEKRAEKEKFLKKLLHHALSQIENK